MPDKVDSITDAMKPFISDWLTSDEEYNRLIETSPGEKQSRVKELLSRMRQDEIDILKQLTT